MDLMEIVKNGRGRITKECGVYARENVLLFSLQAFIGKSAANEAYAAANHFENLAVDHFNKAQLLEGYLEGQNRDSETVKVPAHLVNNSLSTESTDLTDFVSGWDTTDGATEAMNLPVKVDTHTRLIFEMMICRLIDNYMCYLSEIIRAILKSDYRLLKSSEKVELEYVLGFESLEDLKADQIDQKITKLAYSGFASIDEWCTKNFKISLAADDSQRQALIEIIETRNIIVHNRSIVNKKYLSKVKNTTLKEGNIRPLSHKYVSDNSTFIGASVLQFDAQAIQKFSINERIAPQVPH